MEENKILQSLAGVQKSVNDLSSDLRSFKKEVRDEFTQVHESLAELKASAGATDKILEQHPVKRIERIESHLNLTKFSLESSDE
ncbi:MAG TPA: hypothetical protein VJB98_03840 [Candidatus Paceibacterota bacterium]